MKKCSENTVKTTLGHLLRSTHIYDSLKFMEYKNVQHTKDSSVII